MIWPDRLICEVRITNDFKRRRAMRTTMSMQSQHQVILVVRATIKRYSAAALPLVFSLAYSSRLQAEPNTGSSKTGSPQCEAEYQACAKKCDQTQIDVDNQVQQCKNRCATNTDMYCSRTLTSRGGTTATIPKGSAGTLQTTPVTPAPTTPSTSAAPNTGGTLQRK